MELERFRKYSLSERYELLKDKGVFIASRHHESFEVHLFSLDGLYAEVWIRIGLPYIDYIEPLSGTSGLNPWMNVIPSGLE
jgi:hypothetical protein